jgi:arginyl-tRNA--protein-N-Asp/Glu arginylyltransferase
MIKIKTKLPAAELFPNRKNGRHWTKTDTIKKSDIAYGFGACLELPIAIRQQFTKTDKLSLTIYVAYNDNRHRDWDNISSACKALQDGIFQALKVDDSQIKQATIIKMSPDKINHGLVWILDIIK